MTGIVNSTGAKSGIIGTTVGTPASTSAVIGFVHDFSREYNTITGRAVIYEKSITLKSASSIIFVQSQIQLYLSNAKMGVTLYRKTSAGVDTSDTLVGDLNPRTNAWTTSDDLALRTTYESYETFHTSWKDTTSHSVDDEIFYGVAYEKTDGATLKAPTEGITDGTISLTLWEVIPNA